MEPVTTPALPETPAGSSRSREPRATVLPVAEIFSALGAERVGLETIATVIVGDERNPPRRHGLRAPAHRWLQLILALAAEDPALRDELRAALRGIGEIPPIHPGAPLLKPSGRLL